MMVMTYRTSIMRIRVHKTALSAFLVGAMAAQVATADIYTWVDPSGSINVSNLSPPEGAHVTSVMHESAPKVVPQPDVARQEDVQALAQRVRQLEGELTAAQNQGPPPAYIAMPVPTVVQYFVDVGPPQVQYNSVAQPGCDPGWSDCNAWWNTGFYPAGVVFFQGPNFRRFPPARGGRQFVGQPQMRGPANPRRG